MENFLKKHGAKLNTIALVLMLVIPFLLYGAAIHGSNMGLKLFLGLMAAMMLFVMRKG
jgi:hypothetical protein